MRGASESGKWAAAFAILLLSSNARALDPFEIQVYDGLVHAPGEPGVELHINTVPIGLKTSILPDLPQHQQTHFTLEPSVGLTPFWEMGAYLQAAFRRDGTFTYAGVKLRTKFVMPQGWDPHWQLGINVEFSVIPEAYERDRWGNEVRPIVGWEDESWIFLLNPIVDTALAGEGLHDGPSLAPAAAAKFKLRDKVALGFEYYGDYGPIADFSPWREQQHYLFEVFDLLSVPGLELNAGIGEGLSSASNALVLKVIVGYTWERPSAGATTSSSTGRVDDRF
jgi:hypothetical protein